MKELKIARSLEGAEYYKMHLNIINPFLPETLTPKEIEVLSHFMSFEGEAAEKDRFATAFRKIVMERMDIYPGGLGNHLRSLKDKGAVKEALTGELAIHPTLYPQEKEQHYHFKIRKE